MMKKNSLLIFFTFTLLIFSSQRSIAQCDVPNNISHYMEYPARIFITWESVGSDNLVDVFYRVKGSGDAWTRKKSTRVHSEKVRIAGLPANTIYEYFVRAKCDADWNFQYRSNLRNFNTANLPSSPPFRLMEKEINEISISPNPARDQISVSYTSTGSDVNISIIDMIGKKQFDKEISLSEKGLQNEDINVSNLAKGYYILSIQSGDERIVRRFIKS